MMSKLPKSSLNSVTWMQMTETSREGFLVVSVPFREPECAVSMDLPIPCFFQQILYLALQFCLCFLYLQAQHDYCHWSIILPTSWRNYKHSRKMLVEVWNGSRSQLTVRQVPLMATLAPTWTPESLPSGNWTFIDENFPFLSTEATSALPWTIPVQTIFLISKWKYNTDRYTRERNCFFRLKYWWEHFCFTAHRQWF